MNLTRISFVVFFITIGVSYGQKANDSTSIISYVDKIIVKVNLDTQTDAYFLSNKSDNSNVSLLPNTNERITLSLDYEFLGLSVSFAPKFFSENNDEDLKGKSSFTNYQFRFFLGNWTQSLEYSNIGGFYIENTQDFIPDWIIGKDPFIQFPNLKVISWGGSTSYVFNPKFSLRNVVYQTEWQRKSAGSFIPKLVYNYTRFSNKTADDPVTEKAYDVQLAASYYYTWVIHKNWFVAPFISYSLGVRFSNSIEEESGITIQAKNQYLLNTLETGLQLGYSSRKIIFGANMNIHASQYNEDKNSSISNGKVFAKVYLGYRFDAPKFVKKPFKWFNSKLGL